MGRRKIELDREDVIRALKGQTITEAATELGIGRATLVKQIRRLGIGVGRGKYPRKYRLRCKRSLVHQKLVENTGSVLPGDPVALSRVLGIDTRDVKSYLERGRRSSERFIKEILSKAPKDLVLKDIHGNNVPIASIAKMSVMLDQWGRKVSIVVTSKQGTKILLKYKVKDLWGL